MWYIYIFNFKYGEDSIIFPKREEIKKKYIYIFLLSLNVLCWIIFIPQTQEQLNETCDASLHVDC